MSRSVITRILAAGAVALILIFALLWVGSVRRLDSMVTGLEDGFSLHGSYGSSDPYGPAASGPTSGTTALLSFASFELDEGSDGAGSWRFEYTCDGNADLDYAEEGRFEQTLDPNVYALFDREGARVGIAHLAYEEAPPVLSRMPYDRRGRLYLIFDDGDAATLYKQSAALIEHDLS